ncbi:MAG: hypothetical protein JO218_16815 [Burkholderiales bacterium]|nr:hypothetical protein [Burkholderiales bacterium]
MQQHNALFTQDPTGYLGNVVVDNATWFRTLQAPLQLAPLNLNKAGLFDLVPAAINPRRVLFQPTALGQVVEDVGIDAYWCPFLAGGGLPGWVDLPERNPARRFMFTASMQGCALVVTRSPVAGHIRVYHHQHPGAGNNGIWDQIHAVGQAVVSVLTFDDYCGDENIASNAFNFMYYRNSQWHYVTQAHILVPVGMTFVPTRRPAYGNNGVAINSVLG